MSKDTGMSPTGHGEGPPSDTIKNTEILWSHRLVRECEVSL
jgi:hypothetical protein